MCGRGLATIKIVFCRSLGGIVGRRQYILIVSGLTHVGDGCRIAFRDRLCRRGSHGLRRRCLQRRGQIAGWRGCRSFDSVRLQSTILSGSSWVVLMSLWVVGFVWELGTYAANSIELAGDPLTSIGVRWVSVDVDRRPWGFKTARAQLSDTRKHPPCRRAVFGHC